MLIKFGNHNPIISLGWLEVNKSQESQSLVIKLNVSQTKEQCKINPGKTTHVADDQFVQGDFNGAEKSLTFAPQEAEKFEPNDPRLGDTLHRLAEILRIKARYHEALPLYERALMIIKRASGPAHPDTSASHKAR